MIAAVYARKSTNQHLPDAVAELRGPGSGVRAMLIRAERKRGSK
jgi:hypothetical protein